MKQNVIGEVMKKIFIGVLIFGTGHTIGRIKGMNETIDAHSKGDKPPILRKLNALGELIGIRDEESVADAEKIIHEYRRFPTPGFINKTVDENDRFEDFDFDNQLDSDLKL